MRTPGSAATRRCAATWSTPTASASRTPWGHGPRATSRSGLRRFVDRFFDGFGRSPVDLARHLVWGAVAYARGLGFEPHRDFRPAAGHLGELAGPSAVGFGRDGKPEYVQGPYDDADLIRRTPEANVGRDNFHFTVPMPMHVG